MRNSQLVVALLALCALLILLVQNTSPSLALVFLGIRTGLLPLSVWMGSAIALGALSTILLAGLMNLWGTSVSESYKRRRWQVSSSFSQPADISEPRPSVSRSQAPPRRPARETQPPPSSTGQRPQQPAAPSPSNPNAADDWQSWNARTPASQWEDWGQPERKDQMPGRQFSKRQEKDRDTAENTLHDMSRGWDDSAQDTVYVAPGGSAVEDALDEIAEGWDDWDSEPENPAETAYAHRYRGTDAAPRRDTIYGPADDSRDVPESANQMAENERNRALAGELEENAGSGRGGPNNDGDVYDADYRVIIPPHRPLEEDGSGAAS